MHLLNKLLDTKFRKDLAFSYFSQVVVIVIGFFQIFLINKYFGVSVFGQLSIIMSAVGMFSMLLTARSNEAVTRFFKREEIKGNYENAKFVLFIGFIIDLITVILLVSLIYILSSFIAKIFLKDINLRDEIFLYSFVTFFTFLRGTLLGYLQSKEMFIQINVATAIESLVKIIMIIVFLFIWNLTNIGSVIYSFLIASILSFLYTLYLFLILYLKEFKNIQFQVNKELLKEYLDFNVKTFLSSSFKIGTSNIDNLILGYYIDATTVGIYQTIKKILSPLLIVTAPFAPLTLPKFISYFETKQYRKLNNLIVNTTKKLFIMGITILVILFIALKPYLLYQNIKYNNIIFVSFLILSVYYLLSLSIWWGRNFIILYNPTLPIYSNLLLSINSFWMPMTILKSGFFQSGLIAISISVILAYIPSWLFAPIVYFKFMKRNGKLLKGLKIK